MPTTTTMQIRTRRRRGRKISRRRPRRQSRRQSLSRRRLKSRSGGKDPHLQGPVESFPLLVQGPVHTKANDEIDSDTIALARELLANPKIKNYLNNVKESMIAKLGGKEDKLYEAILAAAATAKQQAGGAPGDGEEETEDPHPQPLSSAEVPSPRTVFRTIIDIIRRTSIRIPEGRLERIMLVCLIFMMFMEAVGARVINSNINTPGLNNAFNPYHPLRPGQVWSFWNALFALFGFGPGAWELDRQWHGPPTLDQTHFFSPDGPN